MAERQSRHYRVAGLFAGIGGIELGLHRAGHDTDLLVEVDPLARAVLRARFESVPSHEDVTSLAKLPSSIDLVAAGFPCQDLSQAGRTGGINGARSSLISHVFRLLRANPVETILLENVSFMLQLGRGQAMSYIVSELEKLGYMWAYRVVDSRAFGVPQRRRRVYIVASQILDPRTILFADEAGEPEPCREDWRSVACGFYWTEGVRGLGWAHGAIPTLKGGSTVGIPSPPAVILPNGRLVKPKIRAGERLQGFPKDWTRPAEAVGRATLRWRLVGNAVTVPVAAWLGQRLARPARAVPYVEKELAVTSRWPSAAYNVDRQRISVDISEWPKRLSQRSTLQQLLDGECEPLSVRAAAGFLSRAANSRLRFPDGFLDVVRRHIEDELASLEHASGTDVPLNPPSDLKSDNQNSQAGCEYGTSI